MNVNQLIASRCKKSLGKKPEPKIEPEKAEIIGPIEVVPAEEPKVEEVAAVKAAPAKPKKKTSKKAKVEFMVPEEVPNMPDDVLVNVEEEPKDGEIEVAGTDDNDY